MKKRFPTGRKGKMLCFSVLICVSFCVFDCRLKKVSYTIATEKIMQPVSLVWVTDLHSCQYGERQHTLIQAIAEQEPDAVLLGGDIFDDKISDEKGRDFIEEISKDYPCFYVSGNHEYRGGHIDELKKMLRSYGVTVLEGDCVTLTLGEQKINLCGIDDPDAQYYEDHYIGFEAQLVACQSKIEKGDFTILLSHRPERIATYSNYDFDLVLAGHAHGGQWRIPLLLNGLLAPHQGLFPDYGGGLYEEESGISMIVSRGLARESTRIPRIFNRPELVCIELVPEVE